MATETITVVFTDLVGSTELMSRVGPTAADDLRREHFALLREAIEAHGGREVKNLGDGLMVVFPSAAAGVAATVEMQRGFARRNRRAREEMQIRIGVALGDAEAEADDYFGVPVVEAARLCAVAGEGGILVTDLVRMLAGSRGGFAFESQGELELKGLDSPVAASLVAWTPDGVGEDRPPFPKRLEVAVSGSFVGRAGEYAQLIEAWKAVTTAGERRVLMVSGEPGIGKTTLSARFAQQAYEDGALLLYGRLDEDLGIPYQPWIEALTQLVSHAPEALLAEHVAERGAHLARLVPELGSRVGVEPPPAPDGDSERFVLFDCVADLLSRASSECPVLLVLDDLHWADRPTVQLLRHVVTTSRPLALAVLGTFRDSDLTAEHPLTPLLAFLHREQGSMRLALRGLGDDELLALLEVIAGHAMDEQGIALRDALLTETAGNPFFVAEILRHLSETGAIYQRPDGRWAADTDLRARGLPVSVREVVGRRLAALGPDSERVLALGAVIGRDFDVSLLAAVAGMDEDPVIDLCDAAVAAAVLRTTDDPERYTFAHALIEHTLYDGLSPARRARAHRAIAERLEVTVGVDPGTRVGELAYHWAQAVQPTDTMKAVHYARVAGDRALEQLAPDEALRWYTQASELLERSGETDERERAALLAGLGDAQRQCGIAAHRETLLEAARLADELDDVELLTRAVLTNSRGFGSRLGGVDEERIAAIERALARVQDPASAERARLLALLCVEKTYAAGLDERLALAEEALETARRSGDGVALASTTRLVADGIWTVSTLERRLAWSTEATSLVEATSAPLAGYGVHHIAGLGALEVGDLAGYREHLETARRLATRVPHAAVQWNQAFVDVCEAIVAGDLDEAERRMNRARELGEESGQPDTLEMYGAQYLNLCDHRGHLDEVRELVEALVEGPGAMPVYRPVLAYICARHDDPGRAQDLLDEGRASGFALPADYTWGTGIVSWARAATLVGDRASAAVLREAMAPFSHALVITPVTVNLSFAHYLGGLDHLLGDLDAADAHFAEASELATRLESPLLAAFTDAAWAELLADRDRGDDRIRARAMAERALATAAAGGYGYAERAASEVLAALG